jgi:hypothetical protein
MSANVNYCLLDEGRYSALRVEKQDLKMGCKRQWHLSPAIAIACTMGSCIAQAAAGQPGAVVKVDAAGRYSILREGGKDTGCMLTLDTKSNVRGKGKASLAPGCRDQGIVVFDPSGWEMAADRLVLVARKGHKAHLDRQPDGTWKKDPAEGKALSLKKL